MIKEKIIYGLFTIIPLTIGGLLYYLFCPDVYFVKIIDYYTNLNLHIRCDVSVNEIINFFRNYFFDYLWAFAFVNALCLVGNSDTKALLINCIISVFVGAVGEIFQYIGVVYGTFDIWDVIFEMLGVVGAVYIILILRRNQNEKI